MERRTFLGTVGTGLAVAVAGCTDSNSGDGDPSGGAGDDSTSNTSETTAPTVETTTTPPAETTDEQTETPPQDTPADTTTGPETDAGETTSESPSSGVNEPVLEVTSSGCGGSAETASVLVEGDEVTVEGLVRGRNSCYTARLAEASVESGTLTVRVEAYVPESDEPKTCQQCLTDIEYTATMAIAAGSPESVVVYHGDEKVTETTPN